MAKSAKSSERAERFASVKRKRQFGMQRSDLQKKPFSMSIRQNKPTELAPVDSIDSEEAAPVAHVSPRPNTNHEGSRFMSLRSQKRQILIKSPMTAMNKTQKLSSKSNKLH